GHVAIQAGRWYVGQLRSQLLGRERPVAEEGLNDPEPDRVQEQIGTGHELIGRILSILGIFSKSRISAARRSFAIDFRRAEAECETSSAGGRARRRAPPKRRQLPGDPTKVTSWGLSPGARPR